MDVTVFPSGLSGKIQVPGSKSVMQRACALAFLHNGQTSIENPGFSDDENAMVSLISKPGVTIEEDKGFLKITGNGNIPLSGTLNCGESGLAFRMFTPIAALSPREVIITGEGSLKRRPMAFFDEVLPSLNVSVESADGFLPLKIQGPLIPREIEVDGSLSSQFITGLLFAYGKAANQSVRLRVNHLVSKPYIDISIQMMTRFGYKVTHLNYSDFIIHPKADCPAEIKIINEGDWSGAAYFLVGGAIAGDIRLCGLNMNSDQGDKQICQILKSCSVLLEQNGSEIFVSKAPKLFPFNYDATDTPDLFPPLVALAVACTGTSIIKGVSRLSTKESNRSQALIDIFSRLGATITIDNDNMVITGGRQLRSATVSGHHDHRMIMAASIAGLISSGPVTIEDAESVNKSYPSFFAHLSKLGAKLLLT